MTEFFGRVVGCVFPLLFFGFGLLQIGAGWAGIENAHGWGWAVAAAVAALMAQFTLPIVYGAFRCAHDIWEWNWFWSAVFAAPGLVFMIPGLLANAIGSIRGR